MAPRLAVKAKEPEGPSPGLILAKQRHADDRLDFGPKKKAFSIGPIDVSYREKVLAVGFVRRYRIGFVQFASVTLVDGNYCVILQDGSDYTPLKGQSFRDEKSVHEYLKAELMG